MKMTCYLTISLLIFSFFTRVYGTQYENQKIKQVDITFVNVPADFESNEAVVRSRMKTKVGGFFSQTDFDNDLKRLAADFDRVEPALNSTDDELIICLKLWPKPIIRTIHFEGNDKLSTKKLQKELGIASLSVFDRNAFNQAFHKLKAYYIRKGFFEAELDYRIKPDPQSNEVDIEILVNEGRSGHVRDIFFVNFTSTEMNEILDKMMTKQYNLFTSWMTGEGTYNEEAVRQDEFVILNYLQDQGYADAKVRIEVKEAKPDKSIVLYIIADKGERYKIGKISISGNCEFALSAIEKLLLVKEGDPYSSENIRDSAKRIMDYYGKKGFIDTIVDYEPKLEFDQLAYSLHFTIEESERYYIGLIKVFGNCSTQTHVILHESLLIPGEVFNANRLRFTEEKLRNIGYFKNVNVYAVKSEGPYGLGANFRDVHIEVEETSTGNASLFLGFSTVESIFGGANVTERNFNIKGFRYLFRDGFRALRGGGEYAHMTTTIGAKSRSYVVSWMKPYFMDTRWSIGVNLEKSITQYISKDYEIAAYGLNFNALYQVTPFLRQGYHYRLKHSHVYIETNDPGKDLEKAAKRHSLVSAIGASFVYDSTNHPQCPTRGLKSRMEGEIAGIGGEVRFVSLACLNQYFYPVTAQSYLKFRGDVRVLQPIAKANDKIPLDERLYLGGDTVIRGYRDYKTGPTFNDGSPKGGLSMQLVSAEYVYQLHPRIDAFAFFDAGGLSSNPWAVGAIYKSVGYGLRLYIMGETPLIVGMGYPIYEPDRSKVKKFFLNVGGRF